MIFLITPGDILYSPLKDLQPLSKESWEVEGYFGYEYKIPQTMTS